MYVAIANLVGLIVGVLYRNLIDELQQNRSSFDRFVNDTFDCRIDGRDGAKRQLQLIYFTWNTAICVGYTKTMYALLYELTIK